MTGPKASPLYSLVGLRFLAALIVVAFHFSKPAAGPLKNFVQNGFVGVTLFFILSGFILSYTYITEPGKIRGNKKEFWVARVARIYPMYLFSIILFAPIIFLWDHSDREQQITSGVASILLIQTWLQKNMVLWNAWNPPGWSLSVEAVFYLIFPFVCIPLSRLKNLHLALLGVIFWIASAFPLIVEFLFDRVDFAFWYYLPLTRIPEFIIGIISGVMWKNRIDKKFDAVAPYTALIALLALIALMCSDVRSDYLKFGMCIPFFVLLIVSLACERGLFVRVLSLRPIVTLGAASYSLYILHWPLWTEINYVFKKLGIQFSSADQLFWVYVAITVLASYLCFRFIEEPASRFIRKWMSRNSSGVHIPAGTLIPPAPVDPSR